MFDARIQQFTLAEIVEGTGVDQGTIHHWVHREKLPFFPKGQGAGFDKSYSGVVGAYVAVRNLARRITTNEIANQLAEETGRTLEAGEAIEWELLLSITRQTIEVAKVSKVIVSTPPFAAWGADRRDAAEITVAEYIEGRELRVKIDAAIPHLSTYRSRRSGGRINSQVRAQLARQGLHAQPVLIFPIGEIVNATLLRLEVIAERTKAMVPA